jgi:hypothetical protein
VWGRDGLGDPGAAGDLADHPPGTLPVRTLQRAGGPRSSRSARPKRTLPPGEPRRNA